MNRRDFFKFLPVAPIALPMTAVAMANEGNEPVDEAIKLVLHGTKKRDGEMMRLGNNTMNLQMPHETDPTKSVALSIGNDGHLWIKSAEDKWKRVVTE